MNEAELIFTALAELSTREVAEYVKVRDLSENKIAGKVGGGIAKSARINLENKTKKKVITNENYLKQPNNPDKLNCENKKQLSSKNVI